jgi:hypothetical protein
MRCVPIRGRDQHRITPPKRRVIKAAICSIGRTVSAVPPFASRLSRLESELAIEKHKRQLAEQKLGGMRSAVARL